MRVSNRRSRSRDGPFNGGGCNPDSAWNLWRSVEVLCFIVGVLIAGAALASANWMAVFWVKADKLSPRAISDAVSFMGAIAALRFIEGVYSSCLAGLQRHVSMNIVSVVLATVRSVGAMAVLAWVETSRTAFFVWQLVVTLTDGVRCMAPALTALYPLRQPFSDSHWSH